MKVLALTSILSTFAVEVLAVALPSTPFVCRNEEILAMYPIGKNEEVQAQVLSCSDLPNVMDRSAGQKRQTNVCGDACTTNCFSPAGGGPNPNDCQVIANALLYDSQNIGLLSEIPPSNCTKATYLH